MTRAEYDKKMEGYEKYKNPNRARSSRKDFRKQLEGSPEYVPPKPIGGNKPGKSTRPGVQPLGSFHDKKWRVAMEHARGDEKHALRRKMLAERIKAEHRAAALRTKADKEERYPNPDY